MANPIEKLLQKAMYKAVPALKNIESDLKELELFKSIFSITKLEDGYVINIKGNIGINTEKNIVIQSKEGDMFITTQHVHLCPPLETTPEEAESFAQYTDSAELAMRMGEIAHIRKLEKMLNDQAHEKAKHERYCSCSVINE